MGRYGINVATYEAMHEDAKGHCAICNEVDRELVIDHCHARHGVRGLICRQCNFMLGFAHDNPDVLRAGAQYLLDKEKFWVDNPSAKHAIEVIK